MRKSNRIGLLFVIGFILFSISCKQENEVDARKQKFLDTVLAKEALIRASLEKNEQPEISIALEAVEAYRNFLYHFEEDSLAPLFNFKLARLYDGVLNDKKQAILEYDKTYQKYPKFSERAILIFFEGNAFHDLGDTTNAIEKLEFFVTKYPDHEFADDARGLINIIRMDPEEFDLMFSDPQDSAS